MFLHVLKDEKGQWYIKRTITNPINVFGVVSQITFGDISRLELEIRRLEGFWTQSDTYEGVAEYTIFDRHEVVWDEEAAVVRNNYVYVQMPIVDIQSDFKQRVISERDQRGVYGYEYDGHSYYTDGTFRSTLGLYLGIIAMDPSKFPSDFSIEDRDGVPVIFTVDEFKALCVHFGLYHSGLYSKCRELQAAILEATSLEDIKLAAQWD